MCNPERKKDQKGLCTIPQKAVPSQQILKAKTPEELKTTWGL